MDRGLTGPQGGATSNILLDGHSMKLAFKLISLYPQDAAFRHHQNKILIRFFCDS